MNTRNSSLPILAFLAVLSAIILLPVGAAASSIALTLTGVLAILAADYGREMAPLSARSNVIAFEASGRSPVGLKEAA
jgi:hypothetical protein